MENITSLGKHLLEEYDDHVADGRKHMLLAHRKQAAQHAAPELRGTIMLRKPAPERSCRYM